MAYPNAFIHMDFDVMPILATANRPGLISSECQKRISRRLRCELANIEKHMIRLGGIFAI
jgi:hypothetical protein